MYKSKINLSERIHFVGIGGIGMSGLAGVMKEMGFNGAEASSYINNGYPCIIWEEDEVIYKQNDCHSNHWLIKGAQGKRKTKSLGGGIMLAGFHSEVFNVLKLTQDEMDVINSQRLQHG